MTPPLTRETLAAIRRLREAATPGPWAARTMYSLSFVDAAGSTDTYSGVVWGSIAICEETEQTDGEGRVWSTSGSAKANAALIALAINNLDALLAAAERGLDVEGGR